MIKLVGIHKIYEDNNNGFLALKDISLDFKEDKFVCILGKSGSGKTTLLNIIGGLDKASAGHMVIDGVLTTKFTETEWDYFRNYKIGFIFQNFSLIEHLTVLDNVMLSIKLQGVSTEEAKERSLKMLDKVKILDQAYKLPKQISGGQRQRVAIARALVNNPDIVLADEPTGNLDKKTTKEVLDLLKEISSDKLIIMVTHSKKIANEYADRIIDLKDGCIISDTKPYLNEKVKIKKSDRILTKFKFIDKIKHSFKNLRMKKWRSFLLSLGLAIGIAGFIIIDGISNGVKINVNKQLNAYKNTPDLIFRLYDNNTNYEDYMSHLLQDKNIKAVKYNKNLILDPIKINNIELNRIKINRENLTYKFTDLENEQLRFFGKVYDGGKWPEKDDEIVLSYDFASSLYDIDNIKTLWEKLENAQLEVASTYYYEVPYYKFMENSEYCMSLPFTDEQTIPVGYDSSLLGDFTTQINTQKNLFNTLIYDYRYTEKVIFCKDYEPYLFRYSNEVKEKEVLTVVGINENEYIDYSIVTKDEYLKLNSVVIDDKRILRFDVFLTDNAKKDLFDIKVKYSNEASIDDVSQTTNFEVPIFNIFVDMIQFIIGLILLVSVVTAGIMLLIVLLISVIERSREIGILRSMGATRSDILSVFLVESGVIGFFAGVIGNILAIIIAIFGNIYINYKFNDVIEKTFNNTHINLIIIKPISGIIAVIVCILFSMLFGLIPAISASKKTPIEALKRL